MGDTAWGGSVTGAAEACAAAALREEISVFTEGRIAAPPIDAAFGSSTFSASFRAGAAFSSVFRPLESSDSRIFLPTAGQISFRSQNAARAVSRTAAFASANALRSALSKTSVPPELSIAAL